MFEGVLMMVCFVSGVPPKRRVEVCPSHRGFVMGVMGVQVVEDGGVHWVGVRV